MLTLFRLATVAASAAVLGHAPPAPPSRVLTVVATDYRLQLPATLPAGPTWLRVANQGREPHQVTLVKLNEGKTPADLVAALKAGGPPPPWAVFVGGPNAVDPHATSATTIVDLQPGSYAAICLIPSADGVPHVMKGMIAPLHVAATRPASDAPMPPADRTIRLLDYGFAGAQGLAAGRHVLLVRNDGPQPHELVLVRLAPGKSLADLERWADKMAGRPPAEFLGGVSPLAPHRSNELIANLTPGRYALVCFLPGPDGKPHFTHGMAQELTIH